MYDSYLSWLLDSPGEAFCDELISSSSLKGADMLRSPKNILLTIERLYHALGKAKISVNLLMSYLNEAEPISIIAEKKIIIFSIVL